jgi:hypothetical protein
MLPAEPPSVDGGEITDKATSTSAPCWRGAQTRWRG